MDFITHPLPNIEAWIRHLTNQRIPVLGRTVTAINHLGEHEDLIAARDIAAEVRRDPLMTLKTLRWAGRAMARRGPVGLSGEIETVEAAVVMMGVTRFFSEFSDLTSFEAYLADFPDARLRLMRVIERSLTASVYAADWAAYRHDTDAAIIQEAALLHDLAEILTWCFAPTLCLKMQKMREQAPTMRSADIQRAVLGISLEDLTVELLRAWRLPSLLLRLTNHHDARDPAVQNVVLAANLARHAANGWKDPALHDDYESIARLLNQTPYWVRHRIHTLSDDTPEEPTTD